MQTAASPSPESWTELVLRDDLGRKQHWLGPHPVDNGTEVEVLLDDGNRLGGAYEWSGMGARWPGLRVRLRVSFETPSTRPIYAVVALPPQALVRLAGR